MIKRALKQVYKQLPFKRQLFQPLRHIGLPQGLYQHLHFEGPFQVDVGNGRSFRIEHRATVVENELFWSGLEGNWEGQSSRIWKSLCEGQTGLILDIGANTGVYALVAGAVAAADAEIVAFEPIERIAVLAERNAALNGGRFRVEHVAASDHDGIATIYDGPVDLPYSASLERAFPGAEIPKQVRTARVDTLVGSASSVPVAACKIDVEGHEAAVLRGMKDTIAAFTPPVLIEVLDASAGEAIEAEVEGAGYRYWNVDEERGLIPNQNLRPLGEHNWNMLLCTAEDFDRRDLGGLLA